MELAARGVGRGTRNLRLDRGPLCLCLRLSFTFGLALGKKPRSSARLGLRLGLSLGLTFGLTFGLAFSLAFGLTFGLTLGLAFGLALCL